MEIRPIPNGGSERPRGERAPDAIDLTRSNRAQIAEVVHDVEERRLAGARDSAAGAHAPAAQASGRDADRLELSAGARALAAEEDADEAARREERVAALRAELAAGGLSTPERVEAAARRLLGG
jgi:anti-sigma28 factor (negative regulator of flagellin synthesis)